MVKKEMGPAAVILATRTLKPTKDEASGSINLLSHLGKNGRPRVEVVAAMDYDLSDLTEAPDNSPAPAAPSVAHDYPQETTDRVAVLPRKATTSRNVHFEAEELKKQFGKLLNESQPAKKTKSRRPDPSQVAQWRNQIINQIQMAPMEIDNEHSGPLVIALVGATGVGKTTTIAKLAAWFTLRQRKKVALISMDCYRIGATDQLRTYGRIMRIPCELALEKENLAHALNRHADKDVILIDTAGKSQYDRDHVAELKEWFAISPAIVPYLTLNAAAQKENHATVIEAYADLRVKGLIVTKLDETRAYAALCQEVAAAKLPVACFCTGQRVPEDFEMASRSWLEKLINQGWSAVAPKLGSMVQ